MSLADVIAMARKSVVRVETPGGQGTGVVVSSGAILTNAHVVGHESAVSLIDEAGHKHEGTVVWRDRLFDLSLIRVRDAPWPPLPVGDLSKVREGDEVIALGHPLGFNFTVTRGIISARSREVDGKVFLQTDAAISPGNSGGPLLDQNGCVIGINTFLVRGGNALSFAIPIDRALTAAGPALSGQQQESAGLRCHVCLAVIGAEMGYCLACGARLRRAPAPATDPCTTQADHPAGGGEKVCPSCGKHQPQSVFYCQACGKDLRRN